MMNVTATAMSATPNATTTQCVAIGSNPISDFLMAVYILAFVFGLTFNVLTLYPIYQQVKQQNVLGIFLLNLSISDLLFVFTMPLWINYYRWDHQWKLGVTSCSIAGFFYYSNMYISIYLLCCISVDRCLVVCYPLRFKPHRTSRYAWVQCAVVYALVTAIHIFILINDDLADAHDDTDNSDRCYETYPLKPKVALYNVIRVGFGFILPLLVLGVSYWRVLATVGKSPGLSAAAKRKVRLLSYGVICIFSICFAPYHILLFVRSLVRFSYEDKLHCGFERNMHFPFSSTLALSSLNCVVDPVLYVLVSNGVRDKLKLCCGRHEQKGTEDFRLTQYKKESSSNDIALI
ncbi:G protein-coupled receptor 184 [Poeciliopsis prolifica]|uniref:G protein-coupled receptor 184 n=1 Tax=Poeciliopsis prolifica TaxID=188132 RepID=UPI0024139A31|nr:G protein-coupled receptor 184 [Poeciliopsis prolifica]XP_054885048.1 G protein-coupled receptor 184 [Poeciliopsis prolifica]XP_054885049.1 G protein-coupled receptor 184 [Poeciliopsis prolifica]